MNLKTLTLLRPGIIAHGIEINAEAQTAKQQLPGIPPAQVHRCSILDFTSDRVGGLAEIKGVLIPINPEVLPMVYDKLAASAGRYVLEAEPPKPHGCVCRRDSRFSKEDITLSLMEKQ